jgi:cardiolipin synthase
MKLIVQPRDGLSGITTALRTAKREIDIVIFRCDRADIEKALDAAVKRGVKVRALIAHTNRGGEKRLRRLEQRLLEAGATVARTGDELLRYHGKFLIIDRTTLYLLGFNLTALDCHGSRSFGIVTKERAHVQEALKLFEADRARQPYEPSGGALVVSPESSRTTLTEFIQGAKKQLLIYDPKVSDAAVIKLLLDRVKQGVDVRIIGKVAGAAQKLPHEKFPAKRLHVRAIVRDGKQAFVGSQSLRRLELESRREVGLIVKQIPVVREIAATFEEDWSQTSSGQQASPRRDETKEEARAASA